MLLITAALRQEISDFKKQLRIHEEWRLPPCHFYKGDYRGVDIGLLMTSVGPSSEALTSVISAIAAGIPISRALFTGFAGGLVPRLMPGQLVVAESIVEPSPISQATSVSQWHCEPQWYETVVCHLRENEIPFCVGRNVSSRVPLLTAQEKERAGKEHDAVMVDMENAVLAAIFSRHGIPFVSVRSISDPMALDVSASLYKLVDAQGTFLPLEGVKLLGTRPRDVLKIPEFARNAQKARSAIFRFLSTFLVSYT